MSLVAASSNNRCATTRPESVQLRYAVRFGLEHAVTIKKLIAATVLVLVGLPVVLLCGVVIAISVMDRSNGSLESSGQLREYLLHVPRGYDGNRQTPLVISLHAGATWPAQHRNLTGWNRLADEHSFIVVYPAGVGEIDALDLPRIWPVDRDSARERDVRFVADLLDTLEAEFNIDPGRIYVNGMSNGGAMAFVLSCTLHERIAAVGLVASAQSRPFDWCPDTRPMPMIAFHGTADPIVPYAGGPLGDLFSPVKPTYPPIESFVANWAARNGCRPDPDVSSAGPNVARFQYLDCRQDAPVSLYSIQGAGHVWPGGKPLPEWRVGSNSNSIDATATMWAFFRRNAR